MAYPRPAHDRFSQQFGLFRNPAPHLRLTTAGRLLCVQLLHVVGMAFVMLAAIAPPALADPPQPCNGQLAPQVLRRSLGSSDLRQPPDTQPDLKVEATCLVPPGTYYFGNV